MTPGTAETEVDEASREESPLLTGGDASAYRALAARLNYLALDRPDVQYAAKEVSKYMSKPRDIDWMKLRRVAKYLIGKPRYVQLFCWQETPAEVVSFTDSDWAGDRVTRKSTSGGVPMLGGHLIKSWSSTQPVIALSSGEAELYALVKGASQATGLMSMLFDYGLELGARVCIDSSAALGIAHRVGLGKTRHIDVQYLWI